MMSCTKNFTRLPQKKDELKISHGKRGKTLSESYENTLKERGKKQKILYSLESLVIELNQRNGAL